MPSRSGRKVQGAGKSARRNAGTSKSPPEAGGLRPRLQILAGFLLPLVVLGLWLNSRGFFISP